MRALRSRLGHSDGPKPHAWIRPRKISPAHGFPKRGQGCDIPLGAAEANRFFLIEEVPILQILRRKEEKHATRSTCIRKNLQRLPRPRYKDFRNAAPYVQGFRNTAESPVFRVFSGKIGALEAHCRELGGEPGDLGISCDLSYAFRPLPKVPIYLVFNDADEEFPADCSMLFEKSAEHYLDMECLAIIGMVLAEWLAKKEQKDIASLK